MLLWNNDGYGEIKTYMLERQIAPIGVDIFTPDFLAIARGFGCQAVRPGEFRGTEPSIWCGLRTKRAYVYRNPRRRTVSGELIQARCHARPQ